MQFTYFVLNYDHNRKKVVPFNIFQNCNVQEHTEKLIKKYLRSPKKFTHNCYREGKVLDGFEALVEEIDSLIKWQEAYRCEYEIGVCYKFEEDIESIEHMDCYIQAHMNIEAIVREVIRQYKEQIKDGG